LIRSGSASSRFCARDFSHDRGMDVSFHWPSYPFQIFGLTRVCVSRTSLQFLTLTGQTCTDIRQGGSPTPKPCQPALDIFTSQNSSFFPILWESRHWSIPLITRNRLERRRRRCSDHFSRRMPQTVMQSPQSKLPTPLMDLISCDSRTRSFDSFGRQGGLSLVRR
jgi:hypothetical protein